MKKLIVLLFTIGISPVFAQDNPYEVFGYETKIKYSETSDLLRIKNVDTSSVISTLVFDFENKYVLLLDTNNALIQTLLIEDEKLLRWLSVDPLANKYPDCTPYKFALNNPLYYIDPDGLTEDTYYIDEKGNPLHYSSDKLPNTFVVVKNDKINEFNNLIYYISAKGQCAEDGDMMNQFLKKSYAKEIYDVTAMEAFYEANKNDVHVIEETGLPNKAGFMNEHGVYLYKNNGIIAPGNENIQGTTTITVWDIDPTPELQGTYAGKLHLHVNSGKLTTMGVFQDRPSDTDFRNGPSNGEGFNAVVTPFNVYLHNRTNFVKMPR